MPSNLPFRSTTASGERFDISFPLHPETVSPVRVSQILSAILAAIDSDVRLDPVTGNGDVLQAVAMAIAIRASMIEAPKQVTDRLAADLLHTALAALDDADRHYTHVGHG